MIEALWKQNNLHLEDPKDQNSQFEKFMSKWMVKFLLFHTMVKIVAKISLLFLALGGQSVVILMMVWPMTIWLGIEWCRMIFV